MAHPTDQSRLQAEGRKVALVLVGTVAIWLAAQALIGALGLDPSFLILADLAAGAAFIWALVVTWRISRRQNGRQNGRHKAGSTPPGRNK